MTPTADPDRPVPTVEASLRSVAGRLQAAGIPEPRAEARRLIELATGWSREHQLLASGAEIGPAEAVALERLVRRRQAREPMAYIRGRAPFWDLELTVGPGVLVPRPETETLVEAALAHVADSCAVDSLLDLGVGSGCLALTLLRVFPMARGVGVDVSEAALGCTGANAQRLGLTERLTLVHGGWAAAPAGPFRLIVSNPPYIAAGELTALEPEVRDHEPHVALLAGGDGLDAYRALIPEAARRLARGGLLLLEIGLGQADPVERLLRRWGLSPLPRHRDLAGIERCLAASAP